VGQPLSASGSAIPSDVTGTRNIVELALDRTAEGGWPHIKVSKFLEKKGRHSYGYIDNFGKRSSEQR
jgi:hypothetical protein